MIPSAEPGGVRSERSTTPHAAVVDLHVSLVGRRHLADQIVEQVTAAVRDGALVADSPLPSSRELADRLAVSRSTVVSAYDRLMADGLLRSEIGVGVFVADVAGAPAPPPPILPGMPRARPLWEALPPPVDMAGIEVPFDFRSGVPSLEHFPFDTWRGLLSDQFRSRTMSAVSGDPAGLPALRAAISRHLAVFRAVTVHADNLVITNGIQQALDLVVRTLLAPGDVVAVEDPGYPHVVQLLRSHGLAVVGVPVDEEGLDVSRLPDRARLVYVTPSHQYPLGVTMSLERRRALLAWADRVDAVVVEDDYDSEFRFTGQPLEPLHHLDDSWRVIYLGSFSKVTMPTLRLGFAALPTSLVGPVRKAKTLTDWHTSTALQGAMAAFIERGSLAKHIRRMRRLYEERHALVGNHLAADFAGVLTPLPGNLGLHIGAHLPGCAPGGDDAVVLAAGRLGVAVQAFSWFAVDAVPAPGLLIGYGAVPSGRIAEGLRRLRRCLPDD